MITRKLSDGFTLIEVIIYISLFSILIGGVVTSSYTLFESENRSKTKAFLMNEGQFITQKIEYILSNAKIIRSPILNTENTLLSISPQSTELGEPLVISQIGRDLKMFRGSNPGTTLNNTNTQVTNVVFSYNENSRFPISQSIQFEFTLKTKTPDGKEISQTFSNTYYIKK